MILKGLVTVRRHPVATFIACLVVAFTPIPYLACPQWDVTVTDASGRPLQCIYVRLSYQNYSVESDGHETTLVTDASGHVSFPARHRAATLAQRIVFTASSATAGVHASFGKDAFVFAFGDGYSGNAVSGKYVTDWTGSPPKMVSTIVAKRASPH